MDSSGALKLTVIFLMAIGAIVVVHLVSESNAKAKAERLKKTRHMKCPNCGYIGEAKSGRNQLVGLLLSLVTLSLLFSGFWLICWIPLVLYYALTKEWICPKCDFKNVILNYEKDS